MKVLVHLNSHFLTVANDIITSEHVCLLCFTNDENGSADWPWVLRGGSGNLSLIDSNSLGANIVNHLALNLLVGNNYMITISK